MEGAYKTDGQSSLFSMIELISKMDGAQKFDEWCPWIRLMEFRGQLDRAQRMNGAKNQTSRAQGSDTCISEIRGRMDEAKVQMSVSHINEVDQVNLGSNQVNNMH